MKETKIVIDISNLYKRTSDAQRKIKNKNEQEHSNDNAAKTDELNTYIRKALKLAGEGEVVVLTGQGPVWLYLKLAHALHGKASKLYYRSPELTKHYGGDFPIFDHSTV